MSTVRADIVAEIGSTTTVVSAFTGLSSGKPRLIGQGTAPTSVDRGDVNIGLRQALASLEEQVGEKIVPGNMMAASSAAGGLRMTVHGLVHDMTVKAAREAALGAGAILKYVTAGKLGDSELNEVKRQDPNIILLAGGVDYGERETIIHNARALAGLPISAPVIYAGNRALREEVAAIFSTRVLTLVDNVYPRIDELNVEPARKAIQDVFEQHIVRAPGMDRIREMMTGKIIPTPGAVMNAACLLYEEIGDLVAFDVGGATTDVHSVTAGSEEISRMLIAPEPLAKRTVEGDLGVYKNAHNVAHLAGVEKLSRMLGFDVGDYLKKLEPIPQDGEGIAVVKELGKTAVTTALQRHAGRIRYLYSPYGRTTVAEGKDLTGVRWIIGTGGVFARLPGAEAILGDLGAERRGIELYPSRDARVLIDRDYIMACCGVLAEEYREVALLLMKRSLGLSEE